MRKFLSFFFPGRLSLEKYCIFLCLFLFQTLFAGENGNKVYSFRIIQTTDIHGQYSNFSGPSVASLASVVKECIREKGKENTLYIDCGDILQGTFESARDRGKMMIDYLNHTFCEVFVPGNHDLDFGTENFLECFSK